MSAPKKPSAKAPKAQARDRSGALYVLLDPEMLGAMDAWIDRLNTENVGPQWSRTALVRALVARGLKDKADKGEAP